MSDAAREIHNLKPESDEGIAKCGVSVDGTWQRRGFSSLNGCVSAISMDTGKVVDVEALSKVCKKCKEHENDPDTGPQKLLHGEQTTKLLVRPISSVQHPLWSQKVPCTFLQFLQDR